MRVEIHVLGCIRTLAGFFPWKKFRVDQETMFQIVYAQSGSFSESN